MPLTNNFKNNIFLKYFSTQLTGVIIVFSLFLNFKIRKEYNK